MKRFFVLLLAIALLATAPASAAHFSSLGQLQQFLLKRSPDDLAATGPHSVDLEGIILEIHWCGTGNHWQMTLQVDDPSAAKPIGADGPQLTVHFRLHLDAPPFQIGDVVTVTGSLNEMYSSVMIPWILAGTVNGSADF